MPVQPQEVGAPIDRQTGRQKMESPSFRGYVRNCFWISPPSGEALFLIREDGTIVPTLDGYAIIPIAEYRKLIGQAEGTSGGL